jgi:hypothetical protein
MRLVATFCRHELAERAEPEGGAPLTRRDILLSFVDGPSYSKYLKAASAMQRYWSLFMQIDSD